MLPAVMSATETQTEGATQTQPATTEVSAEDMAAMGAVTLTEVAAQKVVEIRGAEGIEEGYGLRVKVLGGGCAGFQYDLFFDEQSDGDFVFESNGVTLFVDQMSNMYLMGTSIDYVEGLAGAGFKFNNPTATGSCGCGSSFSV